MCLLDFHIICPWKRVCPLEINKLESPSPKIALFGSNWSSGSGEKDEKVNSLRTDGRKTDN